MTDLPNLPIISVIPVEANYSAAPGVRESSASADVSMTQLSTLEAARTELERRTGLHTAELLEGLAFKLNTSRRRARGGEADHTIGQMSEQLAQLAGEMGSADRAALSTLASSFAGLSDQADPLDALFAARIAPGPAALLLASLAAGAEEGLRRRRLEKALARLLKSHQGEIGISLFSFLTFGDDPKQGQAMKQLYRQTVDHCATLTDVFKMLMPLPDRETRLRTLTRAIAFELSFAEGSAKIRLATIIDDICRLVLFIGLHQLCDETAQQLAMPSSTGVMGIPGINADRILGELIAGFEQAWLDTDWLERRCGALGAHDVGMKLRLTQALGEIWKYLPLSFFADEDKRWQTLTVFEEMTTVLAELE
jgi:type III secretion system TyeA family effector delivery regulator